MLSSFAVARLAFPSTASADPYVRSSGWMYHSQLFERTLSTCIPGETVSVVDGCANEQVIWATLMRVDNKQLSAPKLGKWYLWHWTHDGNKLRLYTADQVTGPYVERTNVTVQPPPSGYNTLTSGPSQPPHEWSAGDIAYHQGYFLAVPHARRQPSASDNRPSCQETFLLYSFDGLDWKLAGPQPIIKAGSTAGVFDKYEAAYSRFLRDLDGKLVTVGGKYVIYYRGQDAAPVKAAPGVPAVVPKYKLGGAVASAPTGPWQKMGTSGYIADPASTGLFAIGSAIYQPDVNWVYLTLSRMVGTDPNLGSEIYLKPAAAAGSATQWATAGMGDAMYVDGQNVRLGGSYVYDSQTFGGDGYHYMAVETLGPNGVTFTGRNKMGIALLRHPTPSPPAP